MQTAWRLSEKRGRTSIRPRRNAIAGGQHEEQYPHRGQVRLPELTDTAVSPAGPFPAELVKFSISVKTRCRYSIGW
jgi:hypothetical protein